MTACNCSLGPESCRSCPNADPGRSSVITYLDLTNPFRGYGRDVVYRDVAYRPITAAPKKITSRIQLINMDEITGVPV